MKQTRPAPYGLMNAIRPIDVLLIGAGGNGSEFFSGLVRLHSGIVALGGKGLNVTVVDDDTVSESNIVRQRFWNHEIGMPKAVALVNRTNILMGLGWKAEVRRLAKPLETEGFDLVVTAVDNIAARKLIAESSLGHTLWLDMGCDRDKAQAVLGLHGSNKLSDDLPTVLAHFPDMLEQEIEATPSCSAAESISRQDLMINQTIASAAVNMLWRTVRTGQVPYNGIIVDLAQGLTQAIPFMPAKAKESLAA